MHAAVPLDPARPSGQQRPLAAAGPRPSSAAVPAARPDGPAGTRPTGPAGPGPARRLPPPRTPAGRTLLLARTGGFVQLYLEVEAGLRSRRTLRPLMTPLLYETLAPSWVRPSAPGRLERLSGARTAPDRFDAVALVSRGPRWGAIAVRMRRRGAVWLIDQAARPEDGPLPAPLFPPPSDEPDVFELVTAR